MASSSRNKSYGLFLLNDHDASTTSKNPSPLAVDIVAIHGLNGDAYTTWQHENGVLWLRDLLPQSLPSARVFTYGYPSELVFTKSVATLRDYSRNLLTSLNNLCEEKGRPVILVCHSLGGIVCKQVSIMSNLELSLIDLEALVLAYENEPLYGNMLSALSAVVFYGTPHRGSSIADVGNVVGRAINLFLRASQTAGIAGMVWHDLLATLEMNSPSLRDLSESFRNCVGHLDIVTFHETETMSGMTDLVSDRSRLQR